MNDFLTLQNVANAFGNNDRIVLSNQEQNINGFSTNLVAKTDHKYNAILSFFSADKTQHNQRITQENIQTAQNIRTALENRFGGQGILIFNKHIRNINSGRDVTKAVLQNILTDAKKLEQTRQGTSIRSALNNLMADSPQALRQEAAVLRRYHLAPGRVSDQITRVQLELNEAMLSPEELVQQNERLATLRQQTNTLKGQIETRLQNNQPPLTREERVVVERMVTDLATAKTALDNKISSNQSQIASNPLRFENVKGAFTRGFATASQIAQHYKNMLLQSNRPVPQELDAFIAHCQEKTQNPLRRIVNNQERQLQADDIVTEAELKSLKTTEKNLVSQLKTFAKSVRPPLESGHDVEERFKNTKIDLLNKQDWPVITKEIAINAHGSSKKLTSVMTPANQFASLKQSMGDANGISSTDRRSSHANNLWVSELKDGNRVLFTGIRHGINSAFGISNAYERAEANKQRVKELYTTALLKKPDLLAKALAGQTVDLPIVSTSLVTPTGKEKNMLLEQNAAWLAACNGQDQNGHPVCRLTVKDQNGHDVQVTIRPKVVKFNFGVNWWAQKSIISSLKGGWTISDPMIREGLDQLIGPKDPNAENFMPSPTSLVGTYLRTHPDLSYEHTEKIQTLISQIRDLYASGSHRNADKDPYALPARIALLADMCGFTSCYNCKSGKDRTSQMDAEIKALAVQLQTGALAHPTETSATEHRNALRVMMMNAGNHEIQALNTGLGGYNVPVSGNVNKLKGLTDIFNNDQEISTFKGGTEYVPS